MKALLIGGTGIISTAVSSLAVSEGWDVTLLNRGNRSQWVPEGAHVLQADAGDPAALERALAGQTFDVVANFIGFLPQQIEPHIKLFAGRTGQYLYISSAAAYQKPSSHQYITESTPLCNTFWQYGRDKIACEELLTRAYRESGFPITIVRPTLTYGLTMIPYCMNSWGKPYTLVSRLKRGRKIIVPGDGSSLWTMTHNSDFAKGFVGLMGNQRAIGHPFHITSDEALTWDQILKAIADAVGVEAKPVHIASDFIVRHNPAQTGDLLGDKSNTAIFDNSKLKSFVPGFAATTSFVQGVRRSVEYFESHPEMQVVDEEYDATLDRILAAYGE